MSQVPTDFLYNNARYLFATAGLDWATADVNAMLVSLLYNPLLTDQHVSDIPSGAVIVRDVALTSLAVSANGICSGLIPEFDSLDSTYAVKALVLYKKTGSDSTSPLIYYTSTGVGFPFAAQGFNYYVAFDSTNIGWFQV